MMTDREKLVELLDYIRYSQEFSCYDFYDLSDAAEPIADFLISKGVTVRGCGYKAESGISKTGFMCTACHSDVDRDAVYCKYCGAKMVPAPPKEE